MGKAGMADDKNRRVSFRIYDEVNLFYKKIDQELATEPSPAFDDISNSRSLTSDTETAAQDSAGLLPNLKNRLPGFRAQDLEVNENAALNVNISASGIAFTCEEALQEGDYLLIKILLLSSMAAIMAYCKVIYCKHSNPYESQYSYLVGAHFTDMQDADRELLTTYVDKKRLQQHWIRGLILAAVVSIVLAPDVIFGLLFEALHFLFEHLLELSHLAFEFVESGLDRLVEHLFHTDLHQTQVIVFYVLLSVIFCGIYAVGKRLPSFYKRCKNSLIVYILRKKSSLLYYWQELSLVDKIKLALIGTAITTGYILFGM
ncbi:MAG TPA: PilZ domain-containing protein [Methylobacter sp.]